jgi:hypothetical protein
MVFSWSSSVNFTARIIAERGRSSGRMESMCGFCSEAGVLRGQDCRQERAKRELSESRMQTASAMVSSGRAARVRIAWTRGTEGVVREVEEGMRFVRWIAGPSSKHN